MTTKLFKNWWLLLIKALASVIIGLMIIIKPQAMAGALMPLTGILLGISGVALVTGGLSHRIFNTEWTWWLLEGLVDILICLFIILKPLESASLLAIIAGVWLTIMGFIHLATSINIQYYVDGNKVFLFTSILLILAGIFCLAFPGLGLMLVMTLLGVTFLCYGILQVYIAFLLRNVAVEEIGEIEDLY